MQFTTCVLGFESGPKIGYGMYPGAGTPNVQRFSRGHFAMYPVIQVISTTLSIDFPKRRPNNIVELHTYTYAAVHLQRQDQVSLREEYTAVNLQFSSLFWRHEFPGKYTCLSSRCSSECVETGSKRDGQTCI